jgi:hypothetical protein
MPTIINVFMILTTITRYSTTHPTWCGSIVQSQPIPWLVMRSPKCGPQAIVDRKGWC